VNELRGPFYKRNGTLNFTTRSLKNWNQNLPLWGNGKGALSYTPTNEPALFADRGFTAHEFLSDFNPYNMNGRLYDPLVSRFLRLKKHYADRTAKRNFAGAVKK
jgi:hypothetical protein